MRKRTSVAFLALMGLLLFGCGKKTSEDKPTTTKKTTPTTQTTAKPTTSKKQVKKFTVSVVNSIQNAGTVSGTGEVEEGKSTTLKAVAADGYTFLGFYDGETEITKDSEYTITVTKDVNLTAKWMAKTYTLAVKKFSNVDPDDIVEIDDDSLGTVEYEVKELYSTGEEITLTATPAEGYQFNGWWLVDPQEGDHLISTETEYKFSMLPQNSTIKALFGTKKCTIELVSNITEAVDELTIYTDVEGEFINETLTTNYGTEVNIYINEANDGYTFKGFYLLDEDGEYDPDELLDVDYYFTATDSAKYLAFFEANVYDLFVNENIDEGGTYTGVYKEVEYAEDDIEGGFSVTYKESITLTAIAADGYTFVGWYSDGEFENQITTDATYTYTMTVADDNYIYAKYVANDVTVNLYVDTVDGEGNLVADCEIVGECKYTNDIYLKFSDLNPAYDYVGVFTKTLNEETGEYDYTEVPGSYHYANGFKYTIDTPDEINLYFVFELGTRTTFFYTNIEEFDDDLYAEVVGTYGDSIDLVAPTPEGYTFVGWIDDIYVGWSDDDKPYLVDGYEIISTETACPVTNTGYDGYWRWYTRNTYGVRYNKEVGMTVAHNGANLQYGLNYTLDVPELDQHVFKYWYTEDAEFNEIKLTNSLGESLAPWTMILDNTLTIYAAFEKDKVAVIFDTCGGSDIDEQFITIGHNPERPANDPEKDGYTFIDWYTAAEGGILYNFSSPISTSVTVYAQWVINQYEITLESQDDTVLTVNSDKINNTYDYATELELVANILDNGYYFVGWFEGETLISDQATYTYTLPSHDVTLVAKYEAREYKVQFYVCWWANSDNYNWLDISNIKLYLNGELFGTGYVTGEATYVYLKYNSEFTLTVELDSTRPYLYVMDWYGTITGSYTSTHQNQLTYTNTVPARSFYMRPEIGSYKKQLEVSKSTNTGTEGSNPYFTAKGISDNQTKTDVKAECPVKLYATEIAGYTFAGWYIKGTNTLISEDLEYEFIMPYEALQYEARYTNNEYTLTINKNVNDYIDVTEDISNIDTVTVAYHDTYELTTSDMTGYTFLGWFIPGTNTPVSTDLTYEIEMPLNDATYEARFVINEYEIYFGAGISNTDWNLEPGSIDYDGYYYDNHNQTITNVATVKDGWTFLGWYLDTDDNEYIANEIKTYISDFTLLTDELELEYTINAADVSIYAIYEAKTYYITLIENGGTLHGDYSIPVLMGDDFELEVPTPPNDRVFIKWTYTIKGTTYDLTDDEGNSTNPYNFPVDSEEITAKAVYGTAIRTVTFETGYNSSTSWSTDTQAFTSKIESGTTVTKPEDPVRRGYTFDGWFTEEEDGDAWIFTTPISTDKTLYAHWTVLTYNVKLDCSSSNMGSFTYSITGTSISGTVDSYHTSSDTSITTITIEYGQTLVLTPKSFNLGRRFSQWTIYTYTGSYYSGSSTSNWSFKYTYTTDLWFRLSIATTTEMENFIFTSTTTTCNISGLSSKGKTATSLVVPTFVTGIAAGAFEANTVLQSISLPFIGSSKTATGVARLFGYIFSSNSISNGTAVQQKYLNGTTETTAPIRYIPKSLYAVTITDETEIPAYAFHKMEMITSLTLDCDIEVIQVHALEYLKVTSLELPASLKRLETNSLRYMTELKTLVIPNDNMEYIAAGTLYNNSQLESLTIPFVGSSYDATGAEALFGWIFGEISSASDGYYVAKQIYTSDETISDSNTVKYQMPNKLTTVVVNYKSAYTYANVEWGAFSDCRNIKNISINKTGKAKWNASSGSYTTYRIAQNVFRDCSSLVNIDGPYFTTAACIWSYAFYNTALTEFVGRCYDFYTHSFAECHALTSVTSTGSMSGNTIYFETSCFMNCENLQGVSFDDTASTNAVIVYSNAFYGCSSLTSFEYERYLQFVGSGSSFSGCSSLSTFSVLGFSTAILSNSFNGCSSLTSLDISWKDSTEEAKKIISDKAFANCSSLEELTIASDCTSIGSTILTGCGKLKKLTIPYIGKDANVTYASSISTSSSANTANANYILGYYFGKTAYDGSIAKTMYETNTTTATYYLPTGFIELYVTNVNNCIPAYACYNVRSLTTFKVLGKQSTTYDIGTKAFEGTGLVTIDYVSGVVKFYPYCFFNLYINQQLILPDTVTYVGERAFRSNYIKGELVLPNTSINISVNAFYSNNITKVVVNRFTTIREYAFGNNTRLTSVEFNYGTSSSTFGSVEANVFYGCTNTSLVVKYYGTKDQFTALITNGKLATDWNLISSASGTTPAKLINTVSCSDGLLNL